MTNRTKLKRLYRNRNNRVMGVRFPEMVEVLSLICNTLVSSEIEIFTHPVGVAVYITVIQLI
jgi:hypothetical protein